MPDKPAPNRLVNIVGPRLVCGNCGALCYNNSRDGRRFRNRHPRLCKARQDFTAQLASGTRSVDADDSSFPLPDPGRAGKKASAI